MDERRGDGRIDAAAQPEDDPARPDGRANLPDGPRDKVLHRPVLLRAAHADEEIADHVDAALGVKHLGVELNAKEIPLPVLDRGERRILGDSDRLETRRQPDDAVAV